jgi:hypothetical protein
MITCALVAAAIVCQDLPQQRPTPEEAVRIWTSNTKPYEAPPPMADPATRDVVAGYTKHWPFDGPITEMAPTRPLSPDGSTVTYYPYNPYSFIFPGSYYGGVHRPTHGTSNIRRTRDR